MRRPDAGDVLVVYDPTIGGELIRLGEALEGKPAMWNHILIFSHYDANGTPWAIEARPGVVGWTAAQDLARYMSSFHTIDNIKQEKTTAQRVQVVEVARQLFGTPYDWTGIAADCLNALGPDIWQPRAGSVPTHLVCSSLVSYVYDKVGLEGPTYRKTFRTVEPADWAKFILNGHYDSQGTVAR